MRIGRTLSLAIGLAGMVGMQAFATTRTTVLDGGWHVPATWGGLSGIVIPTTNDNTVVNHAVDVTTAANNNYMTIGRTTAGQVNVQSSGTLHVEADARVGEAFASGVEIDTGSLTTIGSFYSGYNNQGTTVVNSGTLNVGVNLQVARSVAGHPLVDGSSFTQYDGVTTVANALLVGVYGAATFRYEGSMDIYGGMLDVKNGFIVDNGTFAVHGSSAVISIDKIVAAAEVDIRANGILKFVFDAVGVSSLDFNARPLEIHVGASIVVDAGTYAGSAGTIQLLDAGAFQATGTNRFSNVTITGFNSYPDAYLKYDDAEATISLILPDADIFYEEWVAGFNLTNGAAAMGADPDGDLFDNLAEYALGGDPTNSGIKGHTALSGVVVEGGTRWFEYIYFERSDAAVRSLSYTPERTVSLIAPAWTTSGFTAAGTGTLNAEFSSVTNRIEIETESTQFLGLEIKFQ